LDPNRQTPQVQTPTWRQQCFSTQDPGGCIRDHEALQKATPVPEAPQSIRATKLTFFGLVQDATTDWTYGEVMDLLGPNHTNADVLNTLHGYGNLSAQDVEGFLSRLSTAQKSALMVLMSDSRIGSLLKTMPYSDYEKFAALYNQLILDQQAP
jgi:hypothetical protein